MSSSLRRREAREEESEEAVRASTAGGALIKELKKMRAGGRRRSERADELTGAGENSRGEKLGAPGMKRGWVDGYFCHETGFVCLKERTEAPAAADIGWEVSGWRLSEVGRLRGRPVCGAVHGGGGRAANVYVRRPAGAGGGRTTRGTGSPPSSAMSAAWRAK